MSKRREFATSLVVGVTIAIVVLLGLQACPAYGSVKTVHEVRELFTGSFIVVTEDAVPEGWILETHPNGCSIAGGGGATFDCTWYVWAPVEVVGYTLTTENGKSYTEPGAGWVSPDIFPIAAGERIRVTNGALCECDIAQIEFEVVLPPDPIFFDDFESGDSRWWNEIEQETRWIYVNQVLIEACGETPPEHDRIVGDPSRCSPSLWQVVFQRGPGKPFEFAKLYTGGYTPVVGLLCVSDPVLLQGGMPFFTVAEGCES